MKIKLLDNIICGLPVKPRAKGDIFDEDDLLAKNLIFRGRAVEAVKEEKPKKYTKDSGE